MEKLEMMLFGFLFAALGYCMYLIQEKNKEVDALNDKITAASLRRKQKQRTRSIRKRLSSVEEISSANTSLTSNPSLSNAEFTKSAEILKATDQKKASISTSIHNNSGPSNNPMRRSKTKI